MITQTAKYAIRALIHLNEVAGSGYCQTREIADTIKVPANYLGKTLQKLAHARVLDSQKGLHGGFRISRPADRISLYEIMVAIEAVPRDLAIEPAQDHEDNIPSGLYAKFAQVSEMYASYMKSTTLADLMQTAHPQVSQFETAEPQAAIPAA